jgi:hypothetical protein
VSSQQQLTALLYELQHAKSPLAQARVLARAWRTLRELSPTDRRLLARNVGFDGSEEILEGLAKRKGGLAPAVLLQALANARSTDASAVSELIAAIRDPQRRHEAVERGVALADELLASPEAEEPPVEVVEALGGLQAVRELAEESPEEALAALNALEADRAEQSETSDAALEMEEASAPEFASDATVRERSGPQPTPEPATALSRRKPPPPPVVDWSRWQSASESHSSTPDSRPGVGPSVADVGSRRFEARAVMGAMGAEQSTFSQLRVLRRELGGFYGSSVSTLLEMVAAFPDGWPRRRALCALLEAGIPDDPHDALELIGSLEREIDRRWCLGILARRGELKGQRLDRALELLSSSSSRRRVTAAARNA